MKTIIKWILIVAVVAVGYRFLFGESEENGNLDLGNDTPFVQETPETDSSGFAWSRYEQLNATEKKAYEVLYNATKKGGLECVITVNSATLDRSVERVIEAVCNDHPELFWLNHGCTYRFDSKAIGLTSVQLEMEAYEYLYYKSNLQNYVNRFNEKANELVKQAEKKGSDYEKALFVYESLVKNNFYAFDQLEETEKSFHDSKCEIIRSAYSALVEGETVCAGYAKAFKVVLDRLGIRNMCVTGDAGGPHAWSCVELDGKSYLFDLTWDDPADGPSLFVGHSYFGITDGIISETHKADESLFAYPDSNSVAYNYYSYQGLRFDDYDFDEINSYVKKNYQDGITIAFADAKSYNAAVRGLLEKGEAKKLDSLRGLKEFSYAVSKGNLTITLFE